MSHQEQPAPTQGEGPDIQQLVIADMHERYKLGVYRYGTGLKIKNGRDMLRDAYEEALDLCVYLRGEMEARKHGV